MTELTTSMREALDRWYRGDTDEPHQVVMYAENLLTQTLALEQVLEPVRLFVEHFVPIEEALINGFDVDAWCELADRAIADG